MTTRGKPREIKTDEGGTDAVERGLVAIRNVYRTAGEPTYEQKMLIEKCEKALSGEYRGDLSNAYRQAAVLGIELDCEEKHKDGKWYPFKTDDAELTLMQKGAL